METILAILVIIMILGSLGWLDSVSEKVGLKRKQKDEQ